jgi:hypothetical protein
LWHAYPAFHVATGVIIKHRCSFACIAFQRQWRKDAINGIKVRWFKAPEGFDGWNYIPTAKDWENVRFCSCLPDDPLADVEVRQIAWDFCQ